MEWGGAFLSTPFQVLRAKLASGAVQAEGRQFRLVYELLQLERALSILSPFVDGCAEVDTMSESPWRVWLLRQAKDAVFDAEDLLDEIGHKARRARKVRRMFFTPLLRHALAMKLRSVRLRLHDLPSVAKSLGLESHVGKVKPSTLDITKSRADTSSLLTESVVFGREEVKEQIVKMLLTSDRDVCPTTTNFSVLTIVGMVGIGKTTLAQLVFNDPNIRENFHLMMWVYVGLDFDAVRLTRRLLECADGENWSSDVRSMDLLQVALSGKLSGKRFLLVLDDVWSEQGLNWDWEKLCAPLLHGEKGSTVLVTTQNRRVADVVRSSGVIELECLPLDDSYRIFKGCVFRDGTSDEHPRLEAIGKEIVKKLRGVPLAVKTVGGLLYSNSDEEVWMDMLESTAWMRGDDDILPVLRLSFEHLPAHLKACFAYCAIFPIGYMFNKHELIKLWMAQGYIRDQRGKRMEDVGGEYFDELLNRSFFQYENDYFYTMHDLMHHLAAAVSSGECVVLAGKDCVQGLSDRVSHLSVQGRIEWKELYVFNRLHTLALFNISHDLPEIPDELFTMMRCLRVLILSSSSIRKLPDSLRKLIHLRYLDLSNTIIRWLPTSLSHLCYLQTLILERCHSLQQLPEGIINLTNLRHLKADKEIVSKIARIGKLTSLQELELFKVSKMTGYKISELGDMKELQGNLCIMNLEQVEGKHEASQARLSDKRYVHALQLKWGENLDRSHGNDSLDGEVLEGLQPHGKLKELMISFNGGKNFPCWMNNQVLSNLKSICLRKCWRWEILPPLGRLPCLKFLELWGMDRVVTVGCEFYGDQNTVGFPSLEVAKFYEMPKWEEWMGLNEGKLFPVLRELDVCVCPKLRRMPPLPLTLSKLRISNVGLNVLPELDCNEKAEGSGSSLSSVEISGCHNLVSISEGLFQQTLSALQSLTIRDCEELISLPQEEEFLSILEFAKIENCPKLSDLHLMPSAQDEGDEYNVPARGIRPASSSEQEPESVIEGSFLLSFEVGQQSIPTSCKPESYPNLALQSLTIRDCEELISLPQEIENCPKLSDLHLVPSSQYEGDEYNDPARGIRPASSSEQEPESIPTSCKPESYPNLMSCQSDFMKHLRVLDRLEIHYLHEFMTKSLTANNAPVSLKYESFSETAYLTITRSSSPLIKHDSSYKDDERDFSRFLQRCLIDLRSLSICGCPDLLILLGEMLPHLAKLEELEIRSCSKLASVLFLQEIDLPSVKFFIIKDCADLESLTGKMLCHLTAVEVLSITDCKELTCLDFQELISLTHLLIEKCPKLSAAVAAMSYSLPETPLYSLSVDDSSLLATDWFVHGLAFLQVLVIQGCQQLMYFSEQEEKGLQSLASLQNLEITGCYNLRCLPEGLEALDSLKTLHITYCPQMQFLPERGLPVGLRKLHISGCPILSERCQQEGPDWPKISHIPLLDLF